jgi:hypothetical protein
MTAVGCHPHIREIDDGTVSNADERHRTAVSRQDIFEDTFR